MSDLQIHFDHLDDQHPGWRERLVANRHQTMRELGWTCEMHEPDPDCPVCFRSHDRSVRLIVAAALGIGDTQ